MAKRNGGIIGPANTPTASVAAGVWRLRDAFNSIKNGTWPLTRGVATNSLRFNSGSSDYLNRTPASAGSLTTWTWSGWIKRSTISTEQSIFFGDSSTTNYGGILFTSSNTLDFLNRPSGGINARLTTTQVFRDVSAWYHIVAVWDTSNATSGNRLVLYINGVRITSFSTETYPSQNTSSVLNTAIAHEVGAYIQANGGSFGAGFNGYMSEIHLVDGQALTPSSFGASNSSGVWYPIPYQGSWGTNGFYLKFANSASLGTDSSGNNNTWTVNNLTSVDQSTDTELNNFCTANPNMKSTSDVVLTEGNLKVVSNYASGWQHSGTTFAVKTGKWYWEAKATVVSATDKTSIGVVQFDTTQVNFVGDTNEDLSSYGISGHGAGTGGYTYAQGDIIMCAMDVTNNKVYWGKNGTWYGTLDPAAGTGSTTQTIDNNNFCMPIVGGYGGSTWELNFGYPQFTIASGNSDANGFGNFEYAVPSGYYALNTKNLNTYG